MIGLMTGSVNVITLNINRIVQDWYRADKPNERTEYNIQGVMHDENDKLNTMWVGDKKEAYASLKGYLIRILERVYKYHIAYKTMMYDLEDCGMITYSNANYLYMKKLYSTIRVLGYY